MIDVHIQFCILFTDLIEEEDDDEEEVHEDDEGMNVVVLDDDANQQNGNIEHTQINNKSNAFSQGHEMQWIFELKVLIGEL